MPTQIDRVAERADTMGGQTNTAPGGACNTETEGLTTTPTVKELSAMAVSKRTRFEVLRRDDHTCQYCGGTAPHVKITVDHVMPTTLGGSDYPDNLVAACVDCNAGKTSIAPDSPLVEKVKGAAADFAMQGAEAAAKIRAEHEASSTYVHDFEDHWNAWAGTDGRTPPMPADWRTSVRQWWRIGIPIDALREAIDLAMRKDSLRSRFAYAAGIVWNKLDQAGFNGAPDVPEQGDDDELMNEYLDGRASGYTQGYAEGFSAAGNAAFAYMEAMDSVAGHIDGREDIAPMGVVIDGA